MDQSATPLNPIEKLCNEIVIGIPDELETSFRSEECIYKVPAPLRDLNEAAYTPRVISIGPIHHDNENLKAMKIQKRRYLKEFCRLRVEKQQKKIILTKLLSTIKDNQEDICRCYVADTTKLGSDQFVEMILLDAVFIFELFLRNKEYQLDNSKNQDDFIIGKPWLRSAIRRDLILLENQLPFSTLEELYELAMSKNNSVSFTELSCQYFEKYKKKSVPTKTILHFTDLVRCFLSFKHPNLKLQNGGPINTLYSANMLQQAGIKFKASPDESLLDIRAWKPLSNEEVRTSAKRAELLMPPLEMDNDTECLLRNLMALEQLHYPGEEYICRYVKLLDFLVDVKKDVDLKIKLFLASLVTVKLWRSLLTDFAEKW